MERTFEKLNLLDAREAGLCEAVAPAALVKVRHQRRAEELLSQRLPHQSSFGQFSLI
jgi:hypothetical protein